MSNLQLLNPYQIIESLKAENDAVKAENDVLKEKIASLEKGENDVTVDSSSS